MQIKLPESGRPRDVYYRKCDLGLDLPSMFVHRLKTIDRNLYPVFHPYKMLWDNLINDYAGELEDPRMQVNYNYGQLNFGFVLTDGQGAPVPDGTWHVWRWCEPHGWAHIINIDCKDREYLNLLIERLWLQAQYNDKYGSGYQKKLDEADEAMREKMKADRADLMNEISKANSGMLNRAAENFARGVVAPHNPKKEIITSYSGQGNRTKIERPLTDREGGLILPDGYGEEW